MAYQVTMYFNDANIRETAVTFVGTEYKGSYGDEMLVVSGFTGTAKFEAFPTTGSKFSRWIYRVGSTTAAQEDSEKNPFYYTGDQNIFIRAEGESLSSDDEEDDSGSTTDKIWALEETSLGMITQDTMHDFEYVEGFLYRFSFSFQKAQNVSFYVKSVADTVGFLSITPQWDEETGYPTNAFLEDDDSGPGANFRMEHSVGTNTTYYLWVRAEEPDTMTIHIELSESSGSEEDGKISKWDWTTSNGSASDEATAMAEEVIGNHGRTIDFSHLVWNDMVTKAESILNAVGKSWDSTFLSCVATKMSEADKTLTADRFNSLVINVDSLYTSNVSRQNSGDPVLGEYFKILTDCMNNRIDLL